MALENGNKHFPFDLIIRDREHLLNQTVKAQHKQITLDVMLTFLAIHNFRQGVYHSGFLDYFIDTPSHTSLTLPKS